MLELSIFVLIVLFAYLVAYLYRTKRSTTVPGLQPLDRNCAKNPARSSCIFYSVLPWALLHSPCYTGYTTLCQEGLLPTASTGNLPNIASAGSLHGFLTKLHKDYGPIASFWYGQQLVVSTAHPDMFRPQAKFFDRPHDFHIFAENLLGGSIMYINGDRARSLRQHLDKPFSHEACEDHLLTIYEVMDVAIAKLGKLVGDHPISLREQMCYVAIRSILLISFGRGFDSDEALTEFLKNYDVCWHDLERYITEPQSTRTDDEWRKVAEAKAKLKAQILRVVNSRKRDMSTSGFSDHYRFIDGLMELSLSEEEEFSMAVFYITAGFHTTGTLVTWLMYYLMKHPQCEEKLRREIQTVLGTRDVTIDNIKDLIYCRQVIDESLRLSALANYAARYADVDTVIGGHMIKKGTPIIQAFSVCALDPSVWKEPMKFDPDRFSPDKKNSIDNFASNFFGFGRRKCPGYKLFYVEATIIVVELLRKFLFKLVDPEQEITRTYSVVTRPNEDIWVTLELIK